jgi:tetratricopeptide (TPR) repeat protein
VSGDRLRPLWDFSDVDGSEQRLRAALAAEGDDRGRAEVMTQLARIDGLRGRYAQGRRLVDEAEALAGDDDVVRARLLLERGRLLRLSGDLAASLPLFEEAFETALHARQDFIAADAAHMAALAGDMTTWTQRGLDLAEQSSAAVPWIAMLLNNLGWWRLQRGEYVDALAAYQGSLAAKVRLQRTRATRTSHTSEKSRAAASRSRCVDSAEPTRRSRYSRRLLRGHRASAVLIASFTKSSLPPTPRLDDSAMAKSSEGLRRVPAPGN